MTDDISEKIYHDLMKYHGMTRGEVKREVLKLKYQFESDDRNISDGYDN